MARDRLAAARAQGQQRFPSQQQDYNYPQAPQAQEPQRNRPSHEYNRDYSGDRNAEDPRGGYAASGSRSSDRGQQHHAASRGYGDDAYGPRSVEPRSRSSSGGRHRRRPSNPPPVNPPPATEPVVFGRAYGGPEEAEPRDFNPNMTTQYVPAPPAITRQRSISGGQRYSEEGGRPYSIPTEPTPDLYQGQYYQNQGHNYENHAPYSAPNPPRTRAPSSALPATPTYATQDEQLSEKASTINLVERDGASFDMQPREVAGQKKAPRGGPTIKAGDVPNEAMGDFFNEISELQQALRQTMEEIQAIQQLHSRLLSLPSAEDPQAVIVTERLTTMSNSTRSFFTDIKNRIHELEQGNANLGALIPAGQSVHQLTMADVGVRTTQVNALKERFKIGIQTFAEVERESRAKTRARLERQVKVVNPGLSPDQISEIVRNAEVGGDGMFSQALLKSGARSHNARGALREVESRAADLARIEQTLIELAQLFNDMAMMVEAQDVMVVKVEQNAVQVSQDMESGVKDVKQAVVHARNARKWRWWIFGISMIILIIIVLVIVFEVVLPQIRKK